MPGPETDHATSLLAKKRLLKLDQIQQRTLRIEPPIFKQFVLTTGNE